MNSPLPRLDAKLAAQTQPGAQHELRWLWHLRWFAFFGQSVTVLVTALVLPRVLYLPGLLAILLFDLILTLAVGAISPRLSEKDCTRCIFFLLCADTVALTFLLYWSGGAHNPFTSFYLLHIALAGILLTRAKAVIVALLSVAGYGMLRQHVLEFCGLEPTWGGISEDLHHNGMLVALILTGVCLAWFVGGLREDLRRRDSELRVSRKLLEREERFAGIATLAAGVAHELATPLSTVAVVCRELERTAGIGCQSKACTEDVRLIREQIERCRAIIDRLNVDSGSDLGTAPESIRIGQLQELLASELAPELFKRVRWNLDQAIQQRSVLTPCMPFLQAIAVLLKNAADADPSRQAIEIFALETALSGSPAVAITISDSGKGIPASVIEHLGEPFKTTKPAGQGMGLGLYIVRLFAERMRGRLDISPRKGGGTDARLTLLLEPKS